MFNRYKALIQYILPQHILSRIIAKIANCRLIWLKNSLIKLAIKYYKVDMNEAESINLDTYDSFNAFFTRALKPGVRSFPKHENVIVSPVDGMISQIGQIEDKEIFQAKKRFFNLQTLLGDNTWVPDFQDGNFATIYLSPKDYHRVHMPIAGELIATRYIPGRLFSVNKHSVDYIPGLFARNERVIMVFKTNIGLVAIIMVGAILVAGISTIWAGKITPSCCRNVQTWHYNKEYSFEIGEQIAHFEFGSTVILLYPKNSIVWDSCLAPSDKIRLGDILGQVI